LNEIPNKLEVLYGFEWFMMRLKKCRRKNNKTLASTMAM